MNWAKWSNDHCYCFVGRLVSHDQNGFVHYMHINRKKKGARSTVGQCLRPTGVYLQLVCRRRRVRVCMSHAFNLNVCVWSALLQFSPLQRGVARLIRPSVCAVSCETRGRWTGNCPPICPGNTCTFARMLACTHMPIVSVQPCSRAA